MGGVNRCNCFRSRSPKAHQVEGEASKNLMGFIFCAIVHDRTFFFSLILVLEGEALFPQEEGFSVEANSPND